MSDTTPTPADLARELIRRLDEYEAERFAVMNNCRDDDVALEQLRDSLVRVVARHARTIAEALLAAEQRVAGMDRVAVVAGEACGELNAAYLEMNRLRERVAAAEARVTELEAACEESARRVNALRMLAAASGIRFDAAGFGRVYDILSAVLAKGKGATPS